MSTGTAGRTRSCYELTPAQYAQYLADGYTLSSGPWSSQADCEAQCDGEDDTGTSTGTDTGTGTHSEISTNCCGNTINSKLYMTIVADDATCDCMDGTYLLTWDDNGQDWVGTIDSPGCTSTSNDVELRCPEDGGGCTDFVLSISSCSVNAVNPGSCSCSPFSLTFSENLVFCCDGGSGSTVTITITE